MRGRREATWASDLSSSLTDELECPWQVRQVGVKAEGRAWRWETAVCLCVIGRNSEQSGISGHRGPDRQWKKPVRWREVGKGPSGKEGLGYPTNIFIPHPLEGWISTQLLFCLCSKDVLCESPNYKADSSGVALAEVELRT